jgi:hypothetical protein
MTEGVRDQPDRPSAGESVMSTRTQRDIVFAHARIGYNKGHGSMQVVALKLDAYLPAVPTRTPSPALVLAHGGVFHRGSKESDVFSDGTGTTTAIAEYCRRFAVLGWPSFSVQYRLAQTDPEPSREPVLTRPDEVPMSRVSFMLAEMWACHRSSRAIWRDSWRLGSTTSPRPYALSKRTTAIMASIPSGSCSVGSRRAGVVPIMPLMASVSALPESFPSLVR